MAKISNLAIPVGSGPPVPPPPPLDPPMKGGRFVSYEPLSLGATKVVHCAVNRTQPCDVILSKTVTSCCHDLSGTKTTYILE